MKAYTSRSRFDESRNFTGVYQQMGRVSLDSDWNEEVRIRTVDARRRTHDLAFGSPDEGFAISDEHLLDAVTSLAGWSGSGLLAGDLRVIPPKLTLDRHDPESLPYVVKGQGHVRIERRFATALDLTRASFDPAGVFAVGELVFSVRFDRPPNDDDPTEVHFVVFDSEGAEVRVPAHFGQALPAQWTEQRVSVVELAGLDTTRIAGWGVSGLPPRAETRIGALEATDASLSTTGSDFVVRGGDGSAVFAGRMFVDGVRIYLRRDVRYSSQPDLPDPPALAALPSDGSLAHVVYLDVWEHLVTALDDPFLDEPALDGLDTTVRLRTMAQVKVLQSTDPRAAVSLPDPTGTGRLSTNVGVGAFPDRYPADPSDPCRDRCLFTESASTGEGYTGSQNVHCRVEIVSVAGLRPVFVWSRDNGSTRMALTADAPSDATSLSVSSEDALRLRAGDIVVLSDARIDLHPEGARHPVLRVVKSSDPATNTVMFHAVFDVASSPDVLAGGGPIGDTFSVADRAYLRRWDGADWLLPNVRYNLPDGIALAFAGNVFRVGEYWSFTARVQNADGVSRGLVEQLTNAPVHGPVHHCVALGRITRQATGLVFEDLRPRFLPLNAVRDRLIELAREDVSLGAFTLTVGDGIRTFGDIDQDLLEGVTADEALQSAVNTLSSAGGGTLYIRAGSYRLEKPVLVSECSRLRILGDGDASELRIVGAGGAFLVDGCGRNGDVGIELLSLVEAPLEDSVIGIDAEVLPPPGEEVQPFEPSDLVRASPATPSFAQSVVSSALTPQPLARRALNAVRATLEELRRLQRNNPGQAVEDLPEAAGLLTALRTLPHGVVTIGDSRNVRLYRLRIQSREPQPEASGVFITGTCGNIEVQGCVIQAASGIVAVPFAPYLSRAFLSRNVRSGLELDGVRLTNNDIRPMGQGVHGVYVADGQLRNLTVSGNRIDGFVVGMVVQSQIVPNGTAERDVLSHNTITGCSGLGIELRASGVDLEHNSVQGSPPSGRVWGGIRVRGSNIRVRNCDITVPRVSLDEAPLNTIAAILVGGGVEEGETAAYRGFGATQDVDVVSCKVDGPGAASPGIGVLIGGPDPVLDVRVRDCDFRSLGDAAIRSWGHGGKVGRVFISSNRIDGVAQAGIPATSDVTTALSEVAPVASAELAESNVAASDPAVMLRALSTSNASDVIVALDALLRWVSLRTLRAAIALDQVVEADVSDNRIDAVGQDGATIGSNVTTAGIAVIGGIDIAVERNRVENVVGEVTLLDVPPGPSQSTLPAAFQTLEELELTVDERRTGRSDVHVATTALRRLILSYAGGDDAMRQRLGRRIYAAMDALVDDLDALRGTGSKIASSLALEADEMRTAQGRDDHTKASHRVRASLSRAAAFTSGGERPEEAWTAAAQFDLAVSNEDPAPAAARLQDAAAELADGLVGQDQAIEVAMAAVIASPRDVAVIVQAASVLGALGELRDAEHQRANATAQGRLLGPKSTVVVRFAERLEQETARLATDTGANNRALLDSLEEDKQALFDSLKGTNDTLAATLEADWRSVERSSTDARKQRLRNTLSDARNWAQGASSAGSNTTDDLARLDDSGTAALTVLVAKHLDNSVARLSVEPEGSKTKNLRVLQTAAGQLRNLVDEDARAAQMASAVSASIAAAISDLQARATHLAAARTTLSAIRRRAEVLVPTPPILPPKLPQSVNADRRLAALCAAALVFRNTTASEASARVALYKGQFASALDGARVTGSVRESSLAAVDGAMSSLATSPAPAARALAVQVLVRELERLVDTFAPLAGSGFPTVAALIRAALIGVSTSDDAPTRHLRAQAHLRENASVLSQSVLGLLAQRSDIDDLLEGLLGLLERLGRGERPYVPELLAPVYDRQLAPAEGIFIANCMGRVRIADNRVHHAVRGLSSTGQSSHPLIGTPNTETGVVAQIDGNRFEGCAIAGIDLQADVDATLSVVNNSVFASAGVAAPSPGERGQAVVSLRGRGQLVVDGNLLQGNGHEHRRALVNELVIDWRGETVVRANTLRHTGGGAGGVGLLIVVENATDVLVRRLATAPFLGIEPPPARRRETLAQPSKSVLPALLDAARGTVATARDSRKQQTGRLSQTVSATRVAPRILTRVAATRPSGVATATANRYLARTTSSPLRQLIDFVRPTLDWRPSPPPPPPEQRTLHIEGNDVAARGPALLLVADQAGDVISTSVVGNGLHSEGGTGAVYVRFAESVVFSGNRCHSPDAINVVVIRALDSAISVTGNVVVGREPVTPIKPPPVIKPKPPSQGGAALTLSLGDGADLRIPVDAGKLRGNLEAFSSEAQQAFSNVLITRAAAEEPYVPPLTLNELDQTPTSESLAGPEPALRLATGARTSPVSNSFAEALESGATRYALSPFTQPQTGSNVIKYIQENKLSSKDAEALIRGTDLVAFESDVSRNAFVAEVDLYRKTKKLEELAAAKNVESAVTRAQAGRVFQRVATKEDTQAGAVAEMTKLFTAQGFDATRTTAEVQALLDQSSGDAGKALNTLKNDIIGVDAATVHTRNVLDNVGLLEKILADGLIRGTDGIAEPAADEADEPLPVTPNPYDYSLVILGGAVVAAVGNATTADTLVLDASEAVELNT